MTILEFQDHVNHYAKLFTDLNYCVIALNGEAGEVAEWYKKAVLRGNPDGNLREIDLLDELGDVLFYLTRIAHLKGWSLEDVMATNKLKLDERSGRGLIVG